MGSAPAEGAHRKEFPPAESAQLPTPDAAGKRPRRTTPPLVAGNPNPTSASNDVMPVAAPHQIATELPTAPSKNVSFNTNIYRAEPIHRLSKL